MYIMLIKHNGRQLHAPYRMSASSPIDDPCYDPTVCFPFTCAFLFMEMKKIDLLVLHTQQNDTSAMPAYSCLIDQTIGTRFSEGLEYLLLTDVGIQTSSKNIFFLFLNLV